jgi:hypothetical protein
MHFALVINVNLGMVVGHTPRPLKRGTKIFRPNYLHYIDFQFPIIELTLKKRKSRFSVCYMNFKI